jgi:sugar phosphate isomerase/epimerase
VVENYSPDHVGIVVDLYHLGLDTQLAQHRRRLSARAKLIQVADRRRNAGCSSERCLPDRGEVPLRSWIRILAMSGYNGPLEAEVIGGEVEGLGYQCVLDSTWDFLTDCREIYRTLKTSKRDRQAQPIHPPRSL